MNTIALSPTISFLELIRGSNGSYTANPDLF